MAQALDQFLISIAQTCKISVYEAAFALSILEERHLGVSFSLEEICRRIQEMIRSTATLSPCYAFSSLVF